MITYPEAQREPSVVVRSRAQLDRLVGQELVPSEWHSVDQQRIDRFAEVTSDFQWIHVDPERARSGPFGSTIAHGYLTLSLVPLLLTEIIDFDRDAVVTMNYGIERTRFPAPVPVDTQIRAVGRVAEVAPSPAGSKIRFEVVVESSSGDKPVLVTDLIWIATFTEEASA